eukprot:TRINITY_DN1278_c1_g1::TRINITY_DN1278_c1_g1_i1::g.26792::m.26792 TRINITY_DN1278_c1_g1::TRINITY_DN1278_c1_g1_i1::g.26792  ORF type:complete len:213 (-),score=5.07,PPDK_N/PF01326.14/0.045 TRINITY_DN1278_c1_g1_i1:147-785(-)
MLFSACSERGMLYLRTKVATRFFSSSLVFRLKNSCWTHSSENAGDWSIFPSLVMLLAGRSTADDTVTVVEGEGGCGAALARACNATFKSAWSVDAVASLLAFSEFDEERACGTRVSASLLSGIETGMGVGVDRVAGTASGFVTAAATAWGEGEVAFTERVSPPVSCNESREVWLRSVSAFTGVRELPSLKTSSLGGVAFFESKTPLSSSEEA